MGSRIGILVLALLLLVSFPAQATKINKADLAATHILMGQVESVEGFYGVNDQGDQIILSRVRVKALKWVKGDHQPFVEFIVEGGAVGDLALKVSDIPEFEKGQRMRLLLKKEMGEFKYEDSEIEEPAKFKPAKPSAGCCKTYAAWPNAPVTYLVNPAGADVANPVPEIQGGADVWNSTVNVLHYGGTTTQTGVNPDGKNLVFFRAASSGGAIAVTYFWYDRRTRTMLNFDMYFFEDAWKFFSYDPKNPSCGEGFYYLTIAAHEFGHAVGIDHNRCPGSIMYPYADYCATNTPTAADLACLTTLYR